jgi:PhnB protein
VAPPPQEPPLSEFYASRRATIKDGAGYLAFVIGWFITGAAFWRVLADGFEAGDFTGAMTKFAGITVLGAVLFGVLGMALGSLLGALWEARHRRTHPVREAALHSAGWVEPDPSAPRPFVAPPVQPTVEPYVVADDIPGLIAFIHDVFDGREVTRVLRPDGRVHHAESRIGTARIMMAEPSSQLPAGASSLYCRVPDCDAVIARAVAAGATLVRPVGESTSGGDRLGVVQDRWGITWWIATPITETSQ